MIKIHDNSQLSENEIKAIIENETWELTTKACQEKSREIASTFDISDLFYYTQGKIFNSDSISVATNITKDPSIPGLYWDEFGMSFTSSEYTPEASVEVNYKCHVLVWRNKFLNPDTNTIVKNERGRNITWDTDIYRGMILYCQGTGDRIGTKNGQHVYTDFIDYVIDSYTDVYNGNAQIRISVINYLSDTNRWNIHTKIGNLYLCADRWYVTSAGSEQPMFELGAEEAEYDDSWYGDAAHTIKMQYHIWIYTNLTNSYAQRAIAYQMYNFGHRFEKIYFHNNLLGRNYHYYLFPIAKINGSSGSNKEYHVKEVHIDNCTEREQGWIQTDGNFKFNSEGFEFDYFAPIKLYSNWLAGNYWYWAQDTNLIRFLDLSLQNTIYARQAFMGARGNNQVVNLDNCLYISSGNSSGNYETFAWSRNFTMNLPLCRQFSQKGGFHHSWNLTFNFGKHADEYGGSGSYFHDMFNNAYDITFNYLGSDPYWSWSLGVDSFKQAYHFKFTKPLYINKRNGTGTYSFFTEYGNGKTDNELITIWGAFNEDTQQGYTASKGLNLPDSSHFASRCDGANFLLLGDVKLGAAAFLECTSKTKFKWEGNLILSCSQSLDSGYQTTGCNFKDCQAFYFIPRLKSFEGTTEFSGSSIQCIDMTHMSLDFVFPDNWTQGADNLKVLIVPTSYTGDTKTPDTVTVIKRDSIIYHDLSDTIYEDVNACEYCYINLNIQLGNNITFKKYSCIGCDGVIYLNHKIATFEDDWNYGGSVIVRNI